MTMVKLEEEEVPGATTSRVPVGKLKGCRSANDLISSRAKEVHQIMGQNAKVFTSARGTGGLFVTAGSLRRSFFYFIIRLDFKIYKYIFLQ